MILFQELNTEDDPIYRDLESENLLRQYNFLNSIITTTKRLGFKVKNNLSETVIKALNYHVIFCLHKEAGMYRTQPVKVGNYFPPDHKEVQIKMKEFVETVNGVWNQVPPIPLASFCLWSLNYIHPFINGNGRTARALCYFIVCVKSGGCLGGSPTLPKLIRKNRPRYVSLLKKADKGFAANDDNFLKDLNSFIGELLQKQLKL